MKDESLNPEFQNKLKVIAAKIRSTNFDKDNLELYHATLDALFCKYYDDAFDYGTLLGKLKEFAEESDPIKFEYALEMIEDVYL